MGKARIHIILPFKPKIVPYSEAANYK